MHHAAPRTARRTSCSLGKARSVNPQGRRRMITTPSSPAVPGGNLPVSPRIGQGSSLGATRGTLTRPRQNLRQAPGWKRQAPSPARQVVHGERPNPRGPCQRRLEPAWLRGNGRRRSQYRGALDYQRAHADPQIGIPTSRSAISLIGFILLFVIVFCIIGVVAVPG